MRKKYIIAIVALCFVILFTIFGISNHQKDNKEDTPNSKNETSVFVDDTSKDAVVDDEIQKDETQNSEVQNGETETWIEPSENSEESKDDNSNNNVVQQPETDNREEDNQEDKKPEWIGGDF